MSLLGRKPILLPDGVTVSVSEGRVEAKGPKGTLSVRLHPDTEATIAERSVRVAVRPGREGAKGTSAQWGTSWSLVRNLVQGVAAGFTKRLELQGVGYRADMSGGTLRLLVGFTHPVEFTPPEGLAVSVEKNIITIAGADKQSVGEFAATVRRVRPPEPYKGKGIRYVGEAVRRKVGKVVGSAGAAA